jgi:hypothetical protein
MWTRETSLIRLSGTPEKFAVTSPMENLGGSYIGSIRIYEAVFRIEKRYDRSIIGFVKFRS